jgi:hypothetical protein
LTSALAARIGALTAREREVLETVCLAGSAIEVAAVARSLNLPLVDGAFAAQQLKGSQLLRIDARGDTRFAEPYHDRVREVVEARFEEKPKRRAERHAAIGQALLDLTPEDRRGPVLFSIVNNLNRAADLRKSPEARAELARLNVQAAKRAAEATAHDQALAYVERGLDLLGDDPWGTQADLSFDLAATRMESEHLIGDHAGARETFKDLAQRARSAEQIGRIYSVKVQLEANADSDLEAVGAHREGLRRLGFSAPRRPSLLRVLFEFARTQWTLRRWSPDRIATLPVATEAAVLAGSRIIIGGSTSVYRADNNLFMVVTFEWLRLSVIYGVTFATPSVIGGYAMMLVGARQQFERATQFAQAALQVSERLAGSGRSIFAPMVAGVWVFPWSRPYRQCIDLLRQAIRDQRGVGESLLVNVCCLGISQIEGWLGSSAADLARESEVARRNGEQLNWRDHETGMAIECRWASIIAADTSEADPLSAFAPPEDPGFRFAPYRASFRRLTAEFHFGSRGRAYAASHALVNEQTMGFALVGLLVVRLYRALAARALVKSAGWFKRLRLQRDIRAARAFIERAARSCPENFRARHLLLEADVSRLRESDDEIDRRFQHAVDVAREAEDLQPLALAHELWAEALLERGHGRRANEQMNLACAAWERYGAPRIAARVRERLGGDGELVHAPRGSSTTKHAPRFGSLSTWMVPS